MKQPRDLHQLPGRYRKRWRHGRRNTVRQPRSVRVAPLAQPREAELEAGGIRKGEHRLRRVQERLKRAGFSCRLVRNCGQGAANPPGYEVVQGATGNY